ncbi:hypothetical protein H7U32_09300 [Bifidobacterium pullorum subsp. saeculare]|uniref:SpaA-like prealbumin fold domain-containing protein n=1 Tax=Bifidobacterium pullorum subsp. saeculare TaxID=78257 RepID=A0A939BAD8_9BIFI|nr:hypothetical protein [Bifidobacterium pullorum]MBM6700473.1 hypothetical protein [Bifidobacterium pullorum subsp. saeculare]
MSAVTTSQAIAMIVSPGKVVKDQGIVIPNDNDGWTVTIDMKNEVTPVTKTVTDPEKVPGVGDTRVWTITSKVPNWNGKNLKDTDTKFTFTDTPGKGQTVDFKSIEITIGEGSSIYDENSMLTKPTSAGTADTWDATGTESFVINLTEYMKTVAVSGPSSKIGQAITMTYESTVNVAAVVELGSEDTIKNRVEVNNNGGTAEASDDLPKPVSFSFTKVDADGAGLAGAHFSLTRSNAPTGAYVPETNEFMKVTTGAKGTYTIDPLNETAEQASGEKKTSPNTEWYPMESGEGGKVTVNGVGDGTYVIQETHAP